MSKSPIRWQSTRGGGARISLSEAISSGLAPDGGLFVPERFPHSRCLPENLSTHRRSFVEFAVEILSPFFEGDPLEASLESICREAFDFPVVLRRYGEDGPRVLELFHGPTAAFKDFGARFLARCLIRTRERSTILVATSGDTGGAVASAFWNLPGCSVAVLFPEGRVSPRQQRQLTGWGGNVRAFAVRGDFDDCQRMVKACFQDRDLARRKNLTSANSINAGRLLPQSTYYAWAASVSSTDRPGTDFIVPTGNLGNALSALWAREMGFLVGNVWMATNANRGLGELVERGKWMNQATVPTLANAMDVGNPSNLERLLSRWPDAHQWASLGIRTGSVDDEAIRGTIVEVDQRWNEAICPHTATAMRLWIDSRVAEAVVVGTAHPAKFEGVVEPLLHRTIPLPERLSETVSRPENYEIIESDPAVLSSLL